MVRYSLDRHVCIVGMPGSGKSHFGKQLADCWSVQHLDLDECIEQVCGLKTSQIFEEFGESFFRMQERLELLKCLSGQAVVLSTGGGCAAFYDNMAIMNAFGFTIYLHRSEDFILDNIQKQSRPIFKQESDLRMQIEELYKQRYPFYKQAQRTLEFGDELYCVENVSKYCINNHIITLKP